MKIIEEGSELHQKCKHFNMQAPCSWVYTMHPCAAKYRIGVEQKRRRKEMQHLMGSGEVVFLMGDKIM